MKHLGEVISFKLLVRLYCFYKGNSEALDSNSMYFVGLR
jgi:hypothetical protein